VELIIYSASKNLIKEELQSNKKVAEDIKKILGIESVLPIKKLSDISNIKNSKIFNLCDNEEKTGSGLLETIEKLNQNNNK